MKTCGKCSVEKEISEYHRDKNKKDGRTSICKVCACAISSRYHKKNREKRLVILRENTKKYDKKNRSKKRKYNRDNCFRKTENHRRRMCPKDAVPGWFDLESVQKVYREVMKMNKNGLDVTVDHIVPIKSPHVCGLHTLDNLQIITRSENSKKNNRWWPDKS